MLDIRIYITMMVLYLCIYYNTICATLWVVRMLAFKVKAGGTATEGEAEGRQRRGERREGAGEQRERD